MLWYLISCAIAYPFVLWLVLPRFRGITKLDTSDILDGASISFLLCFIWPLVALAAIVVYFVVEEE